MRDVTLVLPIRDGKILLGMKKRGFGAGKINGFGGKLNEGESIEVAAVRELEEEIGISAEIWNLEKVGELDFYFPHHEDDSWNQRVHLFLVKEWEGEPVESEEMSCEWYNFKDVPFEKMWDDDKYWLPRVLDGKKIKGVFHFGGDNNALDNHAIINLL